MAETSIKAHERGRESALLLAAILDGFLSLALLVVGLMAGSLTCFAESMRSYMMWTIDLVSLAVLRRVHRGRLSGFDFGTGKIEQLCSIAIAVGLIVGAGWLAVDAFHLAGSESRATPLGLCAAAAVGAVNVFINGVAWNQVRQAARGHRSVIMDAQTAARRTKLLASLIVQATMTGAAVAKDPLVVGWLDAAGAFIVSAVMMRAALGLLGEAVPDLVDRSANHVAAPALVQGAAVLPPGMTIDGFSSRGTARAFVLEVALGCAPATDLATVRTAARLLADELARTLPGVDIRLQVNAVSVYVNRL